MIETMKTYPYLPTSLGHKRSRSYLGNAQSSDSSSTDGGDDGGRERKRYLSSALSRQLRALKIQQERSGAESDTNVTGAARTPGGIFSDGRGFNGVKSNETHEGSAMKYKSGFCMSMGSEVGEALGEVEEEVELEGKRRDLSRDFKVGDGGDDVVTLDLTNKDMARRDWALIKRPDDDRAVVVYKSPFQTLAGIGDDRNISEGRTVGVPMIEQPVVSNIKNQSLFDASFFKREWRRRRERERIQDGWTTTGKRSRDMQLTPYIGGPSTSSFRLDDESGEPEMKRRHTGMEID
eukprot:Plantae.Rhodophyta-Hildenbrandia_rubra.ctg7076.p2 GENE.Plantae.Rhodophyta-Hildenbrandia_rubra.ctg7076~~Plantae.Rhodophyta-Hildenbrandia_rubra.ctg7076.p2  ORF type:complete len:292 (-),score=57.66 Plantae.Rhodophyta-Hildenbrandia_rubra.ctg7076:2826-3701(-)